MIAGAVFRNGQGKNQVDRLAVFGIKGQGFDQLQEKGLNFLGTTYSPVGTAMPLPSAVLPRCSLAQMLSKISREFNSGLFLANVY